MKNTIFLIASSFILFVTSASAQFSAGVRVGTNINNVSVPSVVELLMPDIRYLPGFNFGVVGEYAFDDHFSIMSEMNFQEKGFRIAENTDINLLNINIPVGVRVDTRLRYLSVPLMAKYKFGSGNVKAFVAAGPQIGYALNGRVKTKADLLFDINLTNIPIGFSSSAYQRFDFGGVLAAGIDIPVSQRGTLSFDARYAQGFSDSFKVPVIDLNIKNHGFGFGVGYKMTF